MVDHERIHNTLAKIGYHLETHNSICVSVSGGSDSDVIVHIIATYFREHLHKVHFVFVNTGLEYRATLRHLDDLERKYDISIDRVRGTPIPLAVKRHGIPFLSKNVSEYLSRLQSHDFDYSDVNVDEGIERFGNCKVALRWWCNDWGEGSRFNITRNKMLKEFLMENGLPFKVSSECCHVSKKKPLLKFEKSVSADLVVTGVRKSEGGARAGAYNDCFKPGKNGMDLYMPLFYWNDDTKLWYKQQEGIVHSDCYEVWGMKRTGCVGCPFALKRQEELQLMQKYEPPMHKACMTVFGESYRFTDEYKRFREQDRDEESEWEQEELL